VSFTREPGGADVVLLGRLLRGAPRAGARRGARRCAPRVARGHDRVAAARERARGCGRDRAAGGAGAGGPRAAGRSATCGADLVALVLPAARRLAPGPFRRGRDAGRHACGGRGRDDGR
ncbi:hypothetical protein T492DRAFT_900916, partial [Pavlovales sp. CCMP2436]